MQTSLAELEERIVSCRACPRLRRHCEEVAAEKVRRFAGWDYWGRPVPGFGDARARIFILGLAPGAHGANRTGRMFTGDRSGDFLYRGLHEAGLASQPCSTSRDDGLTLRGVYVSAALRCAPPGNKPLPEEIARCQRFLLTELRLLSEVRVVLALGRIAHDAYLRALPGLGVTLPRLAHVAFCHGATHALPPPAPPCLVDCYHVSQQNTFTGKLTPAMLREVLARSRELARCG